MNGTYLADIRRLSHCHYPYWSAFKIYIKRVLTSHPKGSLGGLFLFLGKALHDPAFNRSGSLGIKPGEYFHFDGSAVGRTIRGILKVMCAVEFP